MPTTTSKLRIPVLGLVVAGLTSAMMAGQTMAQDSCPRLESRLQQLHAAEDPAAFAAFTALMYGDYRVLAIVELVDQDLPPAVDAFGMEIEASYANVVQAWVPVDQLCALASDPAVAGVRPVERLYYGDKSGRQD